MLQTCPRNICVSPNDKRNSLLILALLGTQNFRCQLYTATTPSSSSTTSTITTTPSPHTAAPHALAALHTRRGRNGLNSRQFFTRLGRDNVRPFPGSPTLPRVTEYMRGSPCWPPHNPSPFWYLPLPLFSFLLPSRSHSLFTHLSLSQMFFFSPSTFHLFPSSLLTFFFFSLLLRAYFLFYIYIICFFILANI